MKKLFILFFIFCCLMVLAQKPSTNVSQPQYTSEDTLHWSKDRKLTWDDFKGLPDSNSTGMAGTSSGFFYYSYYNSDTTLEFKVNTIFFKKYSWVKTEYMDSETLNHEQRHFDISEIYAQKLRHAFKNYKLNKTTVIEDCNFIYDSLRVERDKMQKLRNG